MTGQRRLRGRLDDDRHDRRVPRDTAPATGHVELEELSVVRVVARGRGRPGLLVILATGGLAVLLATGFGALGGKPSASQAALSASGSGESSGRPQPTGSGLALGEGPAVTPWMACAAAPAVAPTVLLEVNGEPHRGSIEVLQVPNGVVPPASPIPDREPVAVSSNLPASIWIDGGACANAWDLRFSSETLDTLGNAGLDPLYASQNRFALFLAPFGGLTADLSAVFTFQTMSIRAVWPVSVEPYERPSPYITTGSADGPAVGGCNVTLTLHGDSMTLVDPCDGDLGELPDAAIPVRPDEMLSFTIGDWTLLSASLRCGSLEGRGFVEDAAARCEEGDVGISGDASPMRQALFAPPQAMGTWTVAIDACGGLDDWMGSNQICGTWFANVQVAA